MKRSTLSTAMSALMFTLIIGCATTSKVQPVDAVSGPVDPVQLDVSSSSGSGQDQASPALYAYTTTDPVDVIENYPMLRSTSYPSVAELVSQIADPNRPRVLSEPDAEIALTEQVSHIQQEDGRATVFIERCCALDDSVAGSRITLQLIQKERAWYLEKATRVTLCYRSASETSCS